MDFFRLDNNPFLSGGLILMVFGGALYYLKRIPGIIYDFIERFFIVKIEILDDDEAYKWMQVWLAAKLHKTLLSRSLLKRDNKTPCQDEDEPPVVHGKTRPAIHFVPAVGTYFFWYKGRCVNLNRNREENAGGMSGLNASGADSKSKLPLSQESFTLPESSAATKP